MSKPILNVVSLSGGKDSTAMLLRMLEEGMKVDLIVFCDTGLEFPAMYRHLEKLEKGIDIPITRIRAKYSFEYMMFDAPIRRKADSEITKRYGFQPTGYGWPGPRMRWCTSRLKDTPREQFFRPLREQYELHEYIGLAADEEYRLERIRNKNPGHRHPLVDWGMTEADCLRYCYEHGYDWEGLYEHFRRVSCWCCPLQSLSELRQLYTHFPDLWAKLKDWDRRTWRTFLADYSVEDLEVRFSLENEFKKQGKSITNREFYTALKETLRRNTDEQENTHPRQSV